MDQAPDLYHFCCEHSAAGIEAAAYRVVPVAVTAPYVKGDKDHPLPVLMEVSWFTDMAQPDRFALGLTSTIITCDRTERRFRVLDASGIVRWVDFMREHLSPEERAVARRALPGLPLHWYVSTEPVAVEAA